MAPSTSRSTNHCWGWATWRRAWRRCQGELPFWPQWRASAACRAHTPDKVERAYWEAILDRVHAGQIDSWAYPWTASVWYQGGLTATPNVNLVSNIGFGEDATHTTAANSALAALPAHPLGEIRHPSQIQRDTAADRYAFDHAFGGRRLRPPTRLARLARLPRRAGGFLYRRLKARLTR
jgi:hypothetical protein